MLPDRDSSQRRNPKLPLGKTGWLLLLGFVCGGASAFESGDIQTRSVKANKQAGTIGYKVDIDTRWFDVGGYRPVRITITPTQGSSVDTVISVEFRVSSFDHYHYRNRAKKTIVVTRDIVIPPSPQGSPKPTTATISVPQFNVWNTYSIDFWINGEHEPKLGVALGIVNSYSNLQFNPNPVMLHVDSQRSGTLNFPPVNSSKVPVKFPGTRNTWFRATTITRDELPRRWIDLTSVDIVGLSLDELRKLVHEKNPERWQALRAWTAAGGNLWVADVAKTFHRRGVGDLVQWNGLEELEKLLDLAPIERVNASAWKSKGRGRSRSFHLGEVVALDNISDLGSLSLANASNIVLITNRIDSTRMVWNQRHGLDLINENSDFWNFVIPGVGEVPVTMFQVLITLFVIGIGPLNYIYLRRRGKLHLLIVTTPVFALLITCSLVGYALISDGLGVRVRVRSYTEIDQRRGEAVCWSRMCYYAGLAPSAGLTFSDETAVFPMNSGMEEPRGENIREIVWTSDNQQHLKSGWLRSRNLMQYVTLRSRRTKAKLQLTQSAASDDDGGVGLQGENLLGTAIQYLLVCDAEGKQYWAEDVPDGGTVQFEWADAGDGPGRILNAFRDHQPQFPEHFKEYNRMQGRRRFRGGGSTQFSSSRLEVGMSGVQAWLTGGQMDRRSYVAIVDRSPEVELGLESVQEEASFHVIVGRW